MAKLALDKYYTPEHIAELVVAQTREYVYSLGYTEEEIEWLEPSAGAGVFLKFLPEDTLAFDLEPEHPAVEKQDFLKLWLPPIYSHPGSKRIRVCIGNPPFGDKDGLYKKFFHQACGLAQVIAWVLPINALNNKSSLYQFDLVHSVDLGVDSYSGVDVH